MEMMSTLRREKWKVNLKLKKFRTVFSEEHATAEEVALKMKPPPYKGRGRPPKRPQLLRDNVDEDSSDEDEVQDGEGEGEDPIISEDVGEVSTEESDEDLPRSKDHLEGRIRQLKKVQCVCLYTMVMYTFTSQCSLIRMYIYCMLVIFFVYFVYRIPLT